MILSMMFWSSILAMTLTEPPQRPYSPMSILNTFQALSPGHSGVAFGGRASFRTGDSLHTLAAFSWCDQSAPAVIWHQDAVIAGEVDAGFEYQGSQPGNEIHRFEGHLCRSIPVGCLQGVNHFAGGAQRKAGNRCGWNGLPITTIICGSSPPCFMQWCW